MTEAERIADQLRRAFEGPAWHGDSIQEILVEVTARQAAARPIPNGHTIWEICSHITAWGGVVEQRLDGRAEQLSDAEDWPLISNTSEEAWQSLRADMKKMCNRVRHAALDLDDTRLMDFAVGQDYDIYVMLHGLIQHCVYHAGQIALLKKLTA